MFKKKMVINLLPEKYGVYRLASGTLVSSPGDPDSGFFSLTQTTDETSIVCREELIPDDCRHEKGFRLLKIEGPLVFSLTGILSSLLSPLAAAGIAVFTISTYDTDYLLIKEDKLNEAISALKAVAIVQS
jgi:uncharacterized protein